MSVIIDPSTMASSVSSTTGLGHRAPRLVGPGDRVRGEAGAALKVLLYGSLTEAATRRAYVVLRDAAQRSVHVAFALRHAGPVAAGSFDMPTAIEAAALQGLFWGMCDRIVDVSADPDDLVAHLLWLCVDLDQVRADLMAANAVARLEADVELSARACARSGPAIFVNGSVLRTDDADDGLGPLVRSLAERRMPVGQRPW